MSQHNNSLKTVVDQSTKILKDAWTTADSMSRKLEGKINELKQSVSQQEAAELVVEEEAKKEKRVADRLSFPRLRRKRPLRRLGLLMMKRRKPYLHLKS